MSGNCVLQSAIFAMGVCIDDVPEYEFVVESDGVEMSDFS